MGYDQNFSESMAERPVKRRCLSRPRRRGAQSRRTLAELPHEVLCAVLSFLPAHDVAVARAACKRLKAAGDSVLSSALRRLLSRAEAQLAALSAEEQRASQAGDDRRSRGLSLINWAVAYVAQQLRVLHAVCMRYLACWAEAGGTSDGCRRRFSFSGGLVLDAAEGVLQGAASCYQDGPQDLSVLYVGRLRRLVERWTQHFHDHIEPGLLAPAGSHPPAMAGCKALDLLDSCAMVDRRLDVCWSDAGDWCWGRGRYEILHTALRVFEDNCGSHKLSPRGQQSLHACLARLASRSAENASSHPRVWQEVLGCQLIGSGKWSETVHLEDQVPIMSLQRHSVFVGGGVWLDEEESDEEVLDASDDNAQEQDYEPEEMEEDELPDNEQVDDLEQQMAQGLEEGENEQEEEDEDVDVEVEGPQVQEVVAVEVRFACRRHLAPLRVPRPPMRPLDCSREPWADSFGPRQPDLQLRLTFHSPMMPAAGHCCCLIQQGGRLRPSATGHCTWFCCGAQEYLQRSSPGRRDVTPEQDG